MFPLYLSAATVEGLYEVEYPVETQMQEERGAAIEKAFELLLIRITGNSKIMELPASAELLKEAPQFVRQFRYSESKVSTGQNGSFLDGAKTQQVLHVVFNENAVKQALWNNHLPVWSKTRPATLIWIAIQDSDRRYILDSNETPEIAAVINAQAEKRGIPVIYPLMDLEDQVNIKVSDIWAGFKDNVVKASSRYPAEEIYVARIFLDPFGTWQARWTLLHGDETKVWQNSGADLSEILEQGIWQLGDELAQLYASTALAGDDQNILRLKVADVKNLKDLVRTREYLESVAQISNLYLARVEKSDVTFHVELRSDIAALTRSIALGRTLDKDSQSTQEQMLLSYRLLP